MKSLLSCDSSQNDYSEPTPAETPLWKRLLDVVLILLTLPASLPIFLFIACVIKLVSSGPVFYRQERIGLGGLKFNCLKFRSMKPGADTGVHQKHLKQLIQSNVPMTKMDKSGDPRLIPGGAWLRATGLDELPQLINVLRGEMSLVGPRPCTPYEYEDYSPWHKQRCNTLPGLTGLWQVSGKNKTTFTEMINMDIYYASHKTLWMDLTIIFKTLPALAGQRNPHCARKSCGSRKKSTDNAGASNLSHHEQLKITRMNLVTASRRGL
jgi:lipopolysaccharide/colanic/teichoic acid biosynthesis glycosyltransferase